MKKNYIDLHIARQRLIAHSKNFYKLKKSDPRYKFWADYYVLLDDAKDKEDLKIAFDLAFFNIDNGEAFNQVIETHVSRNKNSEK